MDKGYYSGIVLQGDCFEIIIPHSFTANII